MTTACDYPAGHMFLPHTAGVAAAFGIDPDECSLCGGTHPGYRPGEFVEDETGHGG